MKLETYSCDVCGVQRGPSNHWIVAFPIGIKMWFSPWNELTIEDDAKGLQHICGQKCASTLLSRTIEGWSTVNATEEK